MSDPFRPRELQHARPPCPSPIPGVHPNPSNTVSLHSLGKVFSCLISSNYYTFICTLSRCIECWWASPVAQSKEFACSAGAVGDTGLIPGSGRSPGGENGNALQYSCLENPHGQRSLVGYSPWDHKELYDWSDWAHVNVDSRPQSDSDSHFICLSIYLCIFRKSKKLKRQWNRVS